MNDLAPEVIAIDKIAPFIVTLDAPEWDLASCGELAKLLEPAREPAAALVDLSRVDFIDSTCLGKIAALQGKRMAGGLAPAALVVATPQVRRLFAIVQFDRLWPIFESLDDALRAGA